MAKGSFERPYHSRLGHAFEGMVLGMLLTLMVVLSLARGGQAFEFIIVGAAVTLPPVLFLYEAWLDDKAEEANRE